MKLSELYAILNEYAPVSLSDEYCRKFGAYDNSGILLDGGDEIKKVLFSLDLSSKTLDEAERIGANAVVTHHPVIYGKIGTVNVTDSQGANLQRAIRKGVSVISMHLNMDCAQGGVDEWLMKGVGGKKAEELCERLSGENCGYGRVYDVAPLTLDELTAGIKKEFSTERVAVYGDGKKTVARVASFCGAGGDERAVAFAKRNGADVIVSADFKHHVITYAVETGLSVIALTHYASENYGFEKYYEKIRRQIEVPCVFHTDRELL